MKGEIHYLTVMFVEGEAAQVGGCLDNVEGIEQVIQILIKYKLSLVVTTSGNGHAKEEHDGQQVACTD